MAIVKSHRIKVRFVSQGSTIERTFDLTDASRANAEYRAAKLVPATATKVEVVK